MTIHNVRQDTNFKVTVDQIGRLERGLMASANRPSGPQKPWTPSR